MREGCVIIVYSPAVNGRGIPTNRTSRECDGSAGIVNSAAVSGRGILTKRTSRERNSSESVVDPAAVAGCVSVDGATRERECSIKSEDSTTLTTLIDSSPTNRTSGERDGSVMISYCAPCIITRIPTERTACKRKRSKKIKYSGGTQVTVLHRERPHVGDTITEHGDARNT